MNYGRLQHFIHFVSHWVLRPGVVTITLTNFSPYTMGYPIFWDERIILSEAEVMPVIAAVTRLERASSSKVVSCTSLIRWYVFNELSKTCMQYQHMSRHKLRRVPAAQMVLAQALEDGMEVLILGF